MGVLTHPVLDNWSALDAGLTREQINVAFETLDDATSQGGVDLSGYAPLDSPAFTGSPTAPTVGDPLASDTRIATTAWVAGMTHVGAASVSTPNPAGTTSNSYVMMGLAVTFVPTRAARAIVMLSAQIHNSGNGAETDAILCYGMGSPPSNGDAVTGTMLGQPARFESGSGQSASFSPMSLIGLADGLVIGEPVWFDVALLTVGPSTGSITEVNLVAFGVL